MKNKKISLTDKILISIDNGLGDLTEMLYHPKMSLYKQFHDIPSQKSIYATLAALKKRGLVEKQDKKGKKIYKLTSNGRLKILKYNFKQNKSRWDGKWRIVVFDIPEKEKRSRNFLRGKLYEYDYKYLQKSVWISPWDSLEIIEEIAKNYNLEKYVACILVNYINKQEGLKDQFGLK